MPSAEDSEIRRVEAVILFADIIGSVSTATEYSAEEYDHFMQQFHECALHARAAVEFWKTSGEFKYLLEARGDEVVLVIEADEATTVNAVKAALAYAVALKLNWIGSPYNLARLEQGELPTDLSVGLHKGLVTVRKRYLPEREAPEGFAISFCKRIQTAAHDGEATRILASSEFERVCREALTSARFGKRVLVGLKGISGPVEASEVESILYGNLLSGAGATKSLIGCTDDGTLSLLAKRASEHPAETWVVRVAAVAHLLRASVEYERGNLKGTADFLKRAASVWPAFAEAHNNLGVVLRNLGRFDEAADEYRAAMVISPESFVAHSNLGNLYLQLERFEEAIAEYNEAIRLGPDDPLPHTNLGVAYGNLGRFDDAVRECQEAIRLKPDDALSHSNLADAYLRLDRFDDALTESVRAVELAPDMVEAHFNLGEAYLRLGDREAALAEHEIIKRLDAGEGGLFQEMMEG